MNLTAASLRLATAGYRERSPHKRSQGAGEPRPWRRARRLWRHWTPLQTTNPVESPLAAVRLRAAAAERYEKVGNATAGIGGHRG